MTEGVRMQRRYGTIMSEDTWRRQRLKQEIAVVLNESIPHHPSCLMMQR
jgi:hypothetical protein